MHDSPKILARCIASIALLLLSMHGSWALDQNGAPLNPSILLFHPSARSDGVRLVRRAAKLGCGRVNVVVALLCEIDEDRNVASFGFLREEKYVALDQPWLADFRATLQKTFAEAVAHDLDLAILVHLNSWGKIDDWRNHFRLDPLVRHGRYNYQEALIAPIADALAETIKPSTQVHFSLAGEMGHSLFAHAESYTRLVDELHRDHRLPNLRVGISLNFSSVSGNHKPTPDERQQARQLILGCDFVGLSNYRPFELPPDPSDFAQTVEAFLQEMANHGAPVPDTMPLHFSEVSIGGCKEDGVAAQTPEEAAQTPWKGSNDPQANPWQRVDMRRFRVDYHRALLQFLAHQESAHQVTQAFLWSEGSWDPQGILDPAFADPEITTLIRLHNEAVSGR